MRLRRYNKIRQVDENTWNVRLNDSVLVEWEKQDEEDDSTTSYAVFIVLNLEPFTIMMFIEGDSSWDLEEWQLVDMNCTWKTMGTNELHEMSEDNIELSLSEVPQAMDWIKMANQKGAFQELQ